jgi:hypothetical protein
MNTVNETGPQAGRYLYRTHEPTERSEILSNGALISLTRPISASQGSRYTRMLWPMTAIGVRPPISTA